MQREGVRIGEGAPVALGGQNRPDPFGRPEFKVNTEDVGHDALLPLEQPVVTPQGAAQGTVSGLDPREIIPIDPITQQGLPHAAEIEQHLGLYGTQGLDQVQVADRVARHHEAAVPARCPKADPLRLQQNDVAPPLRQVERDAHTCQPPADNAGLGVDDTGERLADGAVDRGGFVEGVRLGRSREGRSVLFGADGRVQLTSSTWSRPDPSI